MITTQNYFQIWLLQFGSNEDGTDLVQFDVILFYRRMSHKFSKNWKQLKPRSILDVTDMYNVGASEYEADLIARF